jgi:hypothetical protein
MSLIGGIILATFSASVNVLSFGLHVGLGLLGRSSRRLSGRSGFLSHIDKMECLAKEE